MRLRGFRSPCDAHMFSRCDLQICGVYLEWTYSQGAQVLELLYVIESIAQSDSNFVREKLKCKADCMLNVLKAT